MFCAYFMGNEHGERTDRDGDFPLNKERVEVWDITYVTTVVENKTN